MQHVVCYDIADDARRSRVANCLLDFGARVQEGVFVANLEEELAARMGDRLKRLVDATFDRVHVFELCQACCRKTLILGVAEVIEDKGEE